ncbi:MAG: ribulose-phosphate 3-epimerase [Acholeplasmataceae bacterium]|nr:MAG: ribulose-phosphate 3-epimerase [Acholeplasmataceae bacterium]
MKIAPSVLTADFTDLKHELESIDHADFIHLDIMDGHFVPNLSFGPSIAESIRRRTALPLDIHLMVTDPLHWIDGFALPGTAIITIHTEANDTAKTIAAIRDKGIGVGLSIKPGTPVTALEPWLHEAALVLVMTVEPGFGGQAFMPDMLDKVRTLVKLRKEKNLMYQIEVDGGINDVTIKACREAGVDIAVVGSYLFDQKDRKAVIRRLRG